MPPGREEPAEIRAEDITVVPRRRLASIAAYFTVPSMGVKTETAISHIPDVEDIMAWMVSYQAQPFPRKLDRALVADGSGIYAEHCASCHGTYDDHFETPSLVSFPNTSADVGTNKRRLELFGEDVADAVNDSVIGSFIQAKTVSKYAAPPLTGLWSSAPYFHNGSVPTLRALMHPEERPVKFLVGGHAIYLLMAIAGFSALCFKPENFTTPY